MENSKNPISEIKIHVNKLSWWKLLLNSTIFRWFGKKYEIEKPSLIKKVLIENISKLERDIVIDNFVDYACNKERIQKIIKEKGLADVKDATFVLKCLIADIIEKDSDMMYNVSLVWQDVNDKISMRGLLLIGNEIINAKNDVTNLVKSIEISKLNDEKVVSKKRSKIRESNKLAKNDLSTSISDSSEKTAKMLHKNDLVDSLDTYYESLPKDRETIIQEILDDVDNEDVNESSND